MRDVPPDLLAHIQENATAIAVCWKVVRRDGVQILGTTHDRDVTIATGTLAGTYTAKAGITGSSVQSGSDLGVDNMEVQGKIALPGDLSLLDLRAADIEAGLFDDAGVILFMVNWKSPVDGVLILRVGNLGVITRTTEGRYTSELRGLSQRLKKIIIRTYSVTCDAELGDARCTFALSDVTASGTVTGVTDRSLFAASLTGVGSGIDNFIGGLVTFLTGDNAGFSMEVKNDAYLATVPGDGILLYEPMPNDIQIGDTFTMSPGCDKKIETCRDTFDNIMNFRGHGVLVPGRNKIALFGET